MQVSRFPGSQVSAPSSVAPGVRGSLTLPATWAPSIDRHAGRACSREHLDQVAPPQGRPVGARIRRGRLGVPAGSRVRNQNVSLAGAVPASRHARAAGRTPYRSRSCLVPRRPRPATNHRHRTNDRHVAVPNRRRPLVALRRGKGPCWKKRLGSTPTTEALGWGFLMRSG